MTKPTSLDTGTSLDMTMMDRIVRYVVLPLVLAVGLHGLVNYAIKGDVTVRSEVTAMP